MFGPKPDSQHKKARFLSPARYDVLHSSPCLWAPDKIGEASLWAGPSLVGKPLRIQTSPVPCWEFSSAREDGGRRGEQAHLTATCHCLLRKRIPQKMDDPSHPWRPGKLSVELPISLLSWKSRLRSLRKENRSSSPV